MERNIPAVPKKRKRKSKKPGPKSPFNKKMIKQVEMFAMLGANDKEIANFFEIEECTLNKWKNVYPEFKKAIRRGKEIADMKVVRSLYQRALGYSHPDVHILSNRVKVYDEYGNVIEEHTEPLIIDTVKHYPPDTAACLRWLSLRRPDDWMEITKTEHTVNFQGKMEIEHISSELKDQSQFTDEELDLALRLGMKKIMQNGTVTNNN